jgi:multicomponent K+:H+ antiporter subunit E
MSIFARLFPHPALTLGVAGLWVVVASSYTLNSLLVGLVLGFILPLSLRAFLEDVPRIRRPQLALRLFVRVCGDIFVANWQVARQVLGPIDRLRPAFITVPLDTRDPFVTTLLGSIVSLTPGTVSIEIDTKNGTLFAHALNVADEAATAATIKRRYEAPLKEIFGC